MPRGLGKDHAIVDIGKRVDVCAQQTRALLFDESRQLALGIPTMVGIRVYCSLVDENDYTFSV